MATRNPLPTLDTGRIQFPTDQITIGQMRAREPARFTAEAMTEAGATSLEAIAAHFLERCAAEKSFARKAGIPDPHPTIDSSEIAMLLNGVYVSYGISSGLQQSRQLVRKIEVSAASQAKGPEQGRLRR